MFTFWLELLFWTVCVLFVLGLGLLGGLMIFGLWPRNLQDERDAFKKQEERIDRHVEQTRKRLGLDE